MDFIIRVWRGEAGLARTYWLFGGLLSVPFWLWIGSVKPGTGAAVLAGAALGAYLLWVNVGVWRASDREDGRPIFASLARAAAALGFLLAVGVSGGVLYAVATGSWQTPPASSQDFDPEFWKKGGTPVN